MIIHALHGNLGTARDWDVLGLQNVVAEDLWDSVELGFLDWAIEFCQRADPGNENLLLGYSLGGRLGLHALAAGPEIWKGAVIVSANPGLCCPEDRLARRSEDAIWAKWAREMEWDAFLEKWNAQGVLAGQECPAAQARLESRREEIARAFENWSLGAQEDLRERLSRIETPVLWITGERDVKFSKIGAEMADSMPDCHHVSIPGCGHRVIFEEPKAVTRAILDRFGDSAGG